MLINEWLIEEAISGIWQNPTRILAASNNFRSPLTSNRKVEKLVDGSLAFNKPENNATKDQMRFIWRSVAKSDISDINTLINGYISNDRGVKISLDPDSTGYDGNLHGSTVVQGYFLQISPEWVTGIEGEQVYNITAEFQPFEVIA